MEQSNVIDLTLWAAQLGQALGWGEVGVTDEGDWSITTAGGVQILIEPDPELDTRTIMFTAFLGHVDNTIPSSRLLGLLALNMAAGMTGAPVIAYRPADKAITVSSVLTGVVETWHAQNFAVVLDEFCKMADHMAKAYAAGDIDFSEQNQPDAPQAGNVTFA